MKLNIWIICICLLSKHALAGTPGSVEIEIERLSKDLWQTTWSFNEPVKAFRVYPPRLGFRARSWELASDKFTLDETDEGAVISRGSEFFESLVVRFRTDTGFDPKTYVPVLPFSDGGAAIYSGHFSGEIFLNNEWHSVPNSFLLKGLAAESTLLPGWASDLNPVYMYFGKQQPKESSQVVMIADNQMPQWLQDTFDESVPVVTSVFSDQLGYQLERKPLVFIAAGELDEIDGYSIKGAGLDSQFTVMLKGRALHIGSREREMMFQKMLAHELFHIWQQAMPGGDFNPVQSWLHEGSADALAVHALVKAGVWSAEELEQFHHSQKETCVESLGDSDLSEAGDNGNWTAIYACGYLEFTENVEDPFTLWKQLTTAAHKSGGPYTQQMLEEIRGK